MTRRNRTTDVLWHDDAPCAGFHTLTPVSDDARDFLPMWAIEQRALGHLGWVWDGVVLVIPGDDADCASSVVAQMSFVVADFRRNPTGGYERVVYEAETWVM